MARKLADGVYQELVTEELYEALARERSLRSIDVANLPKADAPITLSRFIRGEVERVLGDIHGDDQLDRQVALTNELLAVLANHASPTASQRVASPAQELLSIYPHAALAPRRPTTPLASSALLTMGTREPRLGIELAREFESADRVDALISFITKGGVRQLRDAIDTLSLRHRDGDPPALRIITTTYTGATEAAAVEELALLKGVQVKISYDGRRTRLHAKAWLFHRATGLSSAYVGSANLSAPALTAGLEWMLKVAAVELPHVVNKFEGAFETLWADREFESFDPHIQAQRDRLQGALGAAGRRGDSSLMTYFRLEPYEFQRQILEQLEAERTVHGRMRNLVVAATGTGKTMIAAFDYARRAATAHQYPRLLFLAHTRQILLQARDTFRHVLSSASFGELLTGEDQPETLDHLFATIQTVRSRELIGRLGADYWDHVIIDECHHTPASSYQDIIPRLNPSVLVGLTATPERSDGRSILSDFGGRVAAELRLWHALDRQLLTPFEYYGIHDGIDEQQMSALRWSRGTGYADEDLSELYTGNDVRADRILADVRRKVADVQRMRALGFCVTIKHAEFMAAHFAKSGIAAVALSGTSTSDARAAAQRQLAAGQIQVIFVCDLFNEGVDLPSVDTLLLLRPTESATLFLQQLGRGLRLAEGKDACLVLDFIGQHRAQFRFDAILGSLTGLPRGALINATETGFPFLPAGCSIALDRVSRDTVLCSLRGAVEARWASLVNEARELASRNPSMTLPSFLADTGRDLNDIYRLQQGSWTKLLRDADALVGDGVSTDELDLCHSFEHLLHVNDPRRLRHIASWLSGEEPETPVEQREALMLGYQIKPNTKHFMAAECVMPWLRQCTTASRELTQLAAALADRVAMAGDVRPVAEWPLVLHYRYSRREILTACGAWTPTRKFPHQEGIHKLRDQKRELLFVTLDKSAGTFSATTRYHDYAISDTRFHWQTQNKVAAASPAAEHYANHVALGWSIHLFVQERKGEAFAYCGPVHHERQEGSRPVSIVWRLEYALPAALAIAFKTLASG